MKLKQHIIVYGFPDELKDRQVVKKPTIFVVDEVGRFNVQSFEIAVLLTKLLDKHKISYVLLPCKGSIRIKKLLTGKQRISGRKQGKDIIYTINATTEKELKNKTDAALKELRLLGIKHNIVCKWFCNHNPLKSTKKTLEKTQAPTDNSTSKELKRLAIIIEDQQQDICDLKGKTLEKAKNEDRVVMSDILS